MSVRRFAAAFAVVTPCLLWLHTLHMIAGHEWFATYGLIPAALLAAVVTCSTLVRATTRWTAIAAAVVMLMLFVVIEWLEGELVAGHRLSWPTLADHGWPVLMSGGLLLGGVMIVESVRVIRLVSALVDR